MMRFSWSMFVLAVCWKALFVECGAKKEKEIAKQQCKTFGIIATYEFKVFPDRDSHKEFKECCNGLMEVIHMLGMYNVNQLFNMFVKYFQKQHITQNRRKELLSKLQEIAKALKASRWDKNMMDVLLNNLDIKDDNHNLRLDTILRVLLSGTGTQNNEVYWHIVLQKTFSKCHKFMNNIDSILEDGSWRRFLNIYLQWFDEVGKVRRTYILVDSVMEIYKLCVARKDCLDDKVLLFKMFSLLQDKEYFCGSYHSDWKLPIIKDCLDNDFARKAPFPVLVVAIGNEKIFRKIASNPERRFDVKDVWTELLRCGTNEGCLSSTAVTLYATQQSDISGTVFNNFMRTEVREKSRPDYDGYTFLVLLSRYNYKNNGKNRYSDSADVANAENEHFLKTLFRIQNDITPLSVKSLFIRKFTFQPMAALAEKTNSKCMWTSKDLTNFFIMAKENCLEVEDFAEFLKMIGNEHTQSKMKSILQFINSLNIRFNKKSIWKKLVERNKNIDLYNFIIANANLIKIYGSTSTAHNIFYHFFRNRKMLLCDDPKTFELIYKAVDQKRNHSLNEYDYNEIIEFYCLEEQKTIAALERKKKKEEEEEKAREERRRRDEENRRNQASHSSSEDKKEEKSFFSKYGWY